MRKECEGGGNGSKVKVARYIWVRGRKYSKATIVCVEKTGV